MRAERIVTSNGDVIVVGTGNTITRLAFPEIEYPDPQYHRAQCAQCVRHPRRGADAQELHRCHPRTGMDHQNSPRTTNKLHGKRNVDERSRSLSRTCWTLEWRSSRRGPGRILLVVQSAPPVLLPGGWWSEKSGTPDRSFHAIQRSGPLLFCGRIVSIPMLFLDSPAVSKLPESMLNSRIGNCLIRLTRESDSRVGVLSCYQKHRILTISSDAIAVFLLAGCLDRWQCPADPTSIRELLSK